MVNSLADVGCAAARPESSPHATMSKPTTATPAERCGFTTRTVRAARRASFSVTEKGRALRPARMYRNARAPTAPRQLAAPVEGLLAVGLRLRSCGTACCRHPFVDESIDCSCNRSRPMRKVSSGRPDPSRESM